MKNYKEIDESKKKVGIKLYVFLFIILYFLLELGFTGFYTYTTIGVLYTCLMVFSVYLVYNLIYIYLKFKRHEIAKNKKEEFIGTILKRLLISTIIVFVLFTCVYVIKYIYTMNGAKNAYENYTLNPKTVSKKADNNVENVIVDKSQEILTGMMKTNDDRNKLNGIYESFKSHLGSYIGFRVLTDVIDILIVLIVIYAIDRIILNKIIREKEETVSKNKEIEEKEEKLTKEELLTKLKEDETEGEDGKE